MCSGFNITENLLAVIRIKIRTNKSYLIPLSKNIHKVLVSSIKTKQRGLFSPRFHFCMIFTRCSFQPENFACTNFFQSEVLTKVTFARTSTVKTFSFLCYPARQIPVPVFLSASGIVHFSLHKQPHNPFRKLF